MSDPATLPTTVPAADVAADAPVTYQATLPCQRSTVQALAQRLATHRLKVGTRRGRRALDVFTHAVLFLRWLFDATRIAQLAVDHDISLAGAYRYLNEALDVIADGSPSLRGALIAARAAGYGHVAIDGTLIATDRCSIPGPTSRKSKKARKGRVSSKAVALAAPSRKVDLWWSGKHHHHGGNVQVITAPDGWPLWTSPVRPGREHDTTCARTHDDLLPALQEWSDDHHAVLADLGYEGENHRLTCAVKAPSDGSGLDEDTRAANKVHNATRAPAERGNALLKHFKALRHVTLSPTRIGVIAAAALVVLHLEHDRTT